MENKQIEKTPNKHAYAIFVLTKIKNSVILQMGALKLYSRVVKYAESYDVVSIKIHWFLGAVSPLSKIREIFLRRVVLMGHIKPDVIHVF